VSVRRGFLGAFVLLALVAPAVACAAGIATEIAVERTAELQQRLDGALAAKGPGYVPRTEHRLPDGRPRHTNRLILEDSPYLLQHAHNPVDWFPWGEEAFAKARAENKLVFLSIGYSTCHWCHVMERESFENPGIAALLNAHFVAIKVDRETRPDIDQIYMTAVQLLAGRGGWPMSSILAPTGETIVGGTYYPPEEFADLLERAQALWREREADMRARGERIAQLVRAALAPAERAAALDDSVVAAAVTTLIGQHDDLQGGFGAAPKFPKEPQLALLLDHALRTGDRRALHTAAFTLRAMARGGIHDQVGGGFHRYAIDDAWLVPHFEKMLYNQAQLARLYLQAWRLTGDPGLARVGRRALEAVLRDLTSPEGGFYSATDADSEGGEGRFFLWTPAELRAALPPADAELAIALFGVTAAGNFEGRTILHVPDPLPDAVRALGLTDADLWARVDHIAARLYEVREHRPHPHRDEKILTAWNGMMIATLAEAGRLLREPRYTAAAARAAELIWQHSRSSDGALQRVLLDGRASVAALQEDYAFLAEGLVALYDATGEPHWLERARELADAMLERFWDPTGGGLFMAEARADAMPAMARPKDDGDGPLPAGNAVALNVLVQLALRTGERAYRVRAEELLAAFTGQVERAPAGYPHLLIGLSRLRHGEAGERQYAAGGVVRAEARIARAGEDSATLAVDLHLRPGWHVNGERPLQDYLVPTSIRLAARDRGWRIGRTAYPAPRTVRLGFQREALALYEGSVRITADLQQTDGQGGALPWLPIEVRLQACSDQVCLAPETLTLNVPVDDGRGQ
jgi:hypothetical protein